jgi:hypothetical protein
MKGIKIHEYCKKKEQQSNENSKKLESSTE